MSGSTPLEAEIIREWTADPNEVFPLEQTIRLPSPIQLPNTRKDAYLTVLNMSITTEIPNIFSWTTFNNRRVRVATKDVLGNIVDAWRTIVMESGRYSVSNISSAINTEIASWGWYTNATQPVLQIGSNNTTSRTWVELDDTKLAVGHGTHLIVDMSLLTAQSDLSYTLGFAEVDNPFGNTGPVLYSITENDQAPKVDTQGTHVRILCDDLAPPRFVNSSIYRSLATIPITEIPVGTITPTISWPRTGVTPTLHYSGPRIISSYTIRSLGGRSSESRTQGFPVLVKGLGTVLQVTMHLYS